MRDVSRWATTRGILPHPSVDFFDATRGVRGCVVRGEVKEGDVLVSVPFTACLFPPNSDHADTTVLPSAVVSELTKNFSFGPTSSLTLLVLKLLAETLAEGHLREDSLSNYLKVMPSEFNTLVFFSDDEVALLKGSSAERLATFEHSIFERFTQTILPFLEAHPEVWPENVRTFERFQWAHSVVMTRAFNHDGAEASIMPYIDMFNHHSQPNGALRRTADAFEVTALRDIELGQEVSLSYGDLSNAQLLHIFGFVEERGRNPHNTVMLEASVVEAACDSFDRMVPDQTYSVAERFAKLQALESPPAPGFFDAFELSGGAPLPSGLATVLAAVFLEDMEEDEADFDAYLKDPVELSLEELMLGELDELDDDVVEVLLKAANLGLMIVSAALSSYHTFENNEDMNSPKAAMARQLVEEEKEIVGHTATMFRDIIIRLMQDA